MTRSNRSLVQLQINRRNVEARRAWEAKRSLQTQFHDAWPTEMRSYFTCVLNARRELAQAWLTRSAMLKRQAG